MRLAPETGIVTGRVPPRGLQPERQRAAPLLQRGGQLHSLRGLVCLQAQAALVQWQLSLAPQQPRQQQQRQLHAAWQGACLASSLSA